MQRNGSSFVRSRERRGGWRAFVHLRVGATSYVYASVHALRHVECTCGSRRPSISKSYDFLLFRIRLQDRMRLISY